MPETTLTVIGNLTADPEMRFTPSGAPVANFTIASTPRYFDKQAGSWKDGEALFMRCQVWDQHAEHVVETLTKGAYVVAHGRLRSRTFQTSTGDNRTTWELTVDEIGPALRYATATIKKAERSAGSKSSEQDPWTRPAPTAASTEQEPPF